jgi:exodeoxyribonuclease-5
VETGVFEPIEEVPGVIDYLDPATAEMMIQEAFVDQNREDCRILSFTNGRVIGFNNYLRTHRHLPPELVAGDKVVSNSVTFTQDTPIGAPPKRLRIEQELVVYSTEEPEIYKRLSGLELEVYRVITSAGEVFMPVDRPHLEAVLKHYVKNKEWRSYYHLKENIADLRPRDACTVYKSQGSTYHTVFVDLSDIGTCRVPSQTARMLYVACSRPTHRICFIGDLPPKYRGG